MSVIRSITFEVPGKPFGQPRARTRVVFTTSRGRRISVESAVRALSALARSPGGSVAIARKALALLGVNAVAQHYAAKEQREVERRIQAAFLKAVPPGWDHEFRGPVRARIIAYRECPKSDTRKRTPRPERLDTVKPDGDKLEKAVFDALNGLAFRDDSQICDQAARKVIAAQGEPGRTVVTIEHMEPSDG